MKKFELEALVKLDENIVLHQCHEWEKRILGTMLANSRKKTDNLLLHPDFCPPALITQTTSRPTAITIAGDSKSKRFDQWKAYVFMGLLFAAVAGVIKMADHFYNEETRLETFRFIQSHEADKPTFSRYYRNALVVEWVAIDTMDHDKVVARMNHKKLKHQLLADITKRGLFFWPGANQFLSLGCWNFFLKNEQLHSGQNCLPASEKPRNNEMPSIQKNNIAPHHNAQKKAPLIIEMDA